MQKALTVLFSLVFLVSCVSKPSIPTPALIPAIVLTSTPDATFTPLPDEPERITIEYSSSSENIQNPERGFSTEADLDNPDFSGYYDDGNTLVYAAIRLDEYKNSDLPPEFLDKLDNLFSSVRKGGVKMILRFAYNDGPYPFPEADATTDQILSHIKQLEPVLRKNADVIAWMEAGFIGAWGEWHSSTHGLDKNADAKRQILFAILDALPIDRMVLLRYPVDIMTNFPLPISPGQSFDGSKQSRVGFHNDCFLGSPDDEHTYGRDGVFKQDQEYSYLEETTLYVPVGGESCEYNPPRSDCPTALQEMEFFHFSEIGDGWYPEVLSSWETQGCYSEMEKRLGYRFSLTKVRVNNEVRPGGILNLDVSIKNEGFASLINPRPVYAVLDGAARYTVKLPIEPRRWSPGSDSSFSIQLRVPIDAPSGEYDLALWLPDAYESLQSDNRYSIQFANANIWDEDNGYNLIGNINVSPQAKGSVDVSAKDFSVIP